MITPNTQNRLPSAYLPYQITVAVLGFLALFLVIAGFFLLSGGTSSSPGITETPLTTVAIVLLALATLNVLYQFLYYFKFSFMVADGKITVTSGVLFTSDKSTAFEEVQTVSVKRGPLMRMFGLGNFQGFTGSPDQIQIHSSRSGSYTTYRPDINLVLVADDAEALRVQVSSAIKRVQVVSPER